MNIGFFDSGVGGLIVLKEVLQQLPDYNFVYYGDTQNVPYGDRSESEIFELTKQGIEFLFEKECALVVVACNTASASAVRKLQDTYLAEKYPDRKILGVIIPVIETIVENDFSKIFVMATNYTVESKKYSREIKKHLPESIVYEYAASPLAPLIEAGNKEQAIEFFKNQVMPEINKFNPDVLVLGCTHYGYLKDEIRNILGNIAVLSQDEIIGKKLVLYLSEHPEIEKTLSKNHEHSFYFSKDQMHYESLARLWCEKF